MDSLYVSAAYKSSGKTLFCVGLAAVARARGHRVTTFKKGPDYIDASWLWQASGRPCVNLDFHTMSRGEIELEFAAPDATTWRIVEGTKGLHDGVAADGSDSNATLASLLATPVVLVIDTRGTTRGVAPLLRGISEFDARVAIRGVVLNRVSGPRHLQKLRDAIKTYTDLEVLGALPELDGELLREEHLGLVPRVEDANARNTVEQLATIVDDHIDVEKLLPAAVQNPSSTASVETLGRVSRRNTATEGLRIGIAQDEAFCFYYPGDLARMRALGAELCFFDTLRDAAVPAVDAVMLGGGFPERWMHKLSQNKTMRESVCAFVDSGKPLYAECGGLMYLCRSLEWGAERVALCGVLPADVTMRAKPQGRGYVRLAQSGHAPWGIVGDGEPLRAHEFHYSAMGLCDIDCQYAYAVERGFGVDGSHDGIIHGNVLASYAHLRHTAASPWVDNFVAWAAGNNAGFEASATEVV